ncbi:MAG: DUF4194 domain-containing protein [Candidatus Onthovivens sp.]|nr:DUF4194 domain-containing protein [Mollicutes bacterium]MDD6468575.1 DUF4194 domain-containing protein [Bacilli bacterium]MDY2724706.1 DUF4194 domain-containing protein [Candidatus Onthovivens sp.]MCI6615373.1 DUF4194 domain-containing protein [Mollicutes bacterium]MCI7039594.1 DUF4194 domain-containing protein [Mollicutes bacterium]
MFSEQFAQLSGSDQTRFAEIVNKILLKGFVVRDIFDSREKIIRVNPDFRFIERQFDLINDYLKFSGWVLNKDLILGVFYLVNTFEDNRIRIDRETSLVLFTLRLIYEDEKEEGGSSSTQSIYMTTPSLIKMMVDHGITMPGKRLTGRLIGKSLRFLNNHNIISKVSGSYDEGNVSFYILPSIKYAIDNEKIVAMSNALDQLNSQEESLIK